MLSNGQGLDSLLPPEVAAKAESLGVKKGSMDTWSILLLSILAGAFIALGSMFYTIAVTGTGATLGYGMMQLAGGLAFCLGLILVVVGGAELFTGNNLLIMATVSGKLSYGKLVRNWTLVYVGNLIGSLFTALLIYLADFHLGNGGELGLTALRVAESKCSLPLVPALMRGIYCNALVCLAVWLTFSCRTTGDKILAILFPITAFVAAGFEHCVANMYLIPYGIMVHRGAEAEFWARTGHAAAEYTHLTMQGFIVGNMLPVTIGNIIGGAGFVGLVYFLAYRRNGGVVEPADV